MQLANNYEIIEADNGITGLQLAFDNLPDLILCDIMLPGKDGITLTNQVKADVRSAHIPVILLTAKASAEQQVEGMKSKADAYITNDKFALEDICKQMTISKVQLHRKVKSLLNSNINEYILTARFQKAKYYLRHEELSIAEVAYKTGFSSPAYFSTVFKTKLGVSPTIFKENPLDAKEKENN